MHSYNSMLASTAASDSQSPFLASEFAITTTRPISTSHGGTSTITWEPATCTPMCLGTDSIYGCVKITGCGCHQYDGFPVEVEECSDQGDAQFQTQQRGSAVFEVLLLLVLLLWYAASIICATTFDEWLGGLWVALGNALFVSETVSLLVHRGFGFGVQHRI